MPSPEVLGWLRQRFFPHIWCPGCGHGIIMHALLRALVDLEKKKEKTVIASGIGCSSRMPGYIDACTMHTTHGRSLAFATGVKLANPELTVIDVMGDGDCTAIGGKHFIHACRRNIDITAVIMNNNIYGMTGGQASPTTHVGAYATTAPYGVLDVPFDICKLAVGAGASYVARATIAHPLLVEKYIKTAISKRFCGGRGHDSLSYSVWLERTRGRGRSIISISSRTTALCTTKLLLCPPSIWKEI